MGDPVRIARACGVLVAGRGGMGLLGRAQFRSVTDCLGATLSESPELAKSSPRKSSLVARAEPGFQLGQPALGGPESGECVFDCGGYRGLLGARRRTNLAQRPVQVALGVRQLSSCRRDHPNELLLSH
jgi:hypothetical protein